MTGSGAWAVAGEISKGKTIIDKRTCRYMFKGLGLISILLWGRRCQGDIALAYLKELATEAPIISVACRDRCFVARNQVKVYQAL
jgi:hypothetical protein